MQRQLTPIIERDGYLTLCGPVDVASQGRTIEKARN
jgi:hypothetical protein